MTIINISTI